MDKIFITDLQATGIIGVKQPERDQAQNLLLNVTLFSDQRKAGETDSIVDTINYSSVCKYLVAEVAASRFYTVEALASHLAKALLIEFSAEAVQMRVEKPQVIPRTDRVGVEITRTRQDFGI